MRKFLIFSLLVVAALGISFPASPQTASQLAASPTLPYTWALTVGTSPTQVLGFDPARRRVKFFNPNSTTTIAVCPAVSRANSAAITCAVNGAGSITIVPLASSPNIEGIGSPTAAIPSPWNAVASAPGAALTILEWE